MFFYYHNVIAMLFVDEAITNMHASYRKTETEKMLLS